MPTAGDATLSGVVLCIGLFFLACVITWLDRFLRLLWQKFYAAWNVARIAKNSKQLNLPGEQPNTGIGFSVIWMFIYWSLMIPIVLTEMVLSLECLGGILKRLQ